MNFRTWWENEVVVIFRLENSSFSSFVGFSLILDLPFSPRSTILISAISEVLGMSGVSSFLRRCSEAL